MNVVKFQENLNSPKDHIIFCIIDNTALIVENWNKELTKNISDWTIQNITISGYTVLVGIDEDSLLREAAASTASHAVVISTGTEFIKGYDFFDLLEEYVQQDFFVAGHVLDRKDSYYELHDQCYILNLDLYKKLGLPEVGKMAYYDSHEQYAPTRSLDNFHDDYTPTWIASGTELQTYPHKRHGWNFISLALANGYAVKIFDDNIKSTKVHYYPEHTNSFLREINFAYDRQQFCSAVAVYPFNTEEDSANVNIGTLDQLVVPASGLNWINYLVKYGFKKGTVVKFYDYSLPTLEFTNEVVNNWDGTDYHTFSENFLRKKFGYLSNHYEMPYAGPRINEEAWLEFKKNLNWPEVWNNIKDSVTFEFRYVNLLDTSKTIDWIDLNGTTLINLTNIFNYIGTATSYSVKARIHAENNVLSQLKKIKDGFVILTRRAANGFLDQPNNWPAHVKDVELTNIEDLVKPTWHYNRDWTNSIT